MGEQPHVGQVCCSHGSSMWAVLVGSELHCNLIGRSLRLSAVPGNLVAKLLLDDDNGTCVTNNPLRKLARLCMNQRNFWQVNTATAPPPTTAVKTAPTTPRARPFLSGWRLSAWLELLFFSAYARHQRKLLSGKTPMAPASSSGRRP